MSKRFSLFKKKDTEKRKSTTTDLNTSLLASNNVQMQPKSFFRNDADDASSVSSQRDTEVQATVQTEEGYGWDFVVVLPLIKDLKGKETELEPQEFVQMLHNGGLQTYLYPSAQKDELICKIRAPLNRLRTHADAINYKLLLSDTELQAALEYGVRGEDHEYIIRPVTINHVPAITALHPYQFIYGDYKSERDHLFSKPYPYAHPFTASHRIKLIYSILESNAENCCGLHLEKLLASGSILAYYPLHDDQSRDVLQATWLPWDKMPWDQPIDAIKDYFGEKIGLYFEFLGHYTTWLMPLAIVGVLVSLDIAIEAAIYGNLSDAITSGYTIPFFCIFVAFWGQFMLEYWKTTEATKAMEWGMTSFEEEEEERQEYDGVLMNSYIDGSKIRYFASEEKSARQRYSNFIVTGMMLLVVACVATIFYIKFVMVVESSDTTVNSLGGITASIANAIQIQVLNAVYSKIAVYLTDNENHRTNTNYEDALIAKLFAFQFVNSYASFYYIAFLKRLVGDPCADTCMTELSIALATIFGTQLVVGNASELLVPYIMSRLKKDKEEKGAETPLTHAEKEYIMETYDPMMGSLEDYAELAIQYGFVTLFVAAFPLAPLLALLNNHAEIRTDGFKLLRVYRRPKPQGAEDIGTWMGILQFTSIIAVITNAGIICFTMELIDMEGEPLMWIFVGFQYFVFAFMALFSYLVDDVPEEVTIQLARQQFITDKVLRMVPDEIEDLNVDMVSQPLVIHEQDDEGMPQV